MKPLTLSPDGPHNPDYTSDLGVALAETVRVLNYATRGDAPGLEFPADAGRLIGHLGTAAERMPQLLDQLNVWLGAQHATGRLYDDKGASAVFTAAAARDALREAAALAEDLGIALGKARAEADRLGVRDDGG